MDLNIIFSKTPKASRAPLPWVGGLSAQFKQVLSYVDGKQSVEGILRQSGKMSSSELLKILQKLEDDGYIKRVSDSQAEPDWLKDVSSYAINANNNYSIAVEEIDATELNFDDATFTSEIVTEIKDLKQDAQPPEAEIAVEPDVARRAQEVIEIKAKREAERKAKAEAAEKAMLEAAEQAKRIAEAAAKAQEEVERIEREKAEATSKAKAEEEARLQAEAERKAKAEAEEQARIEAERNAQAEAAEKARLEAERIAREQAEEQARIELERKAQEALAAKAKQEDEERARLEAERLEREKVEAIAKAEAEEEARLQAEAEHKAQAEAAEKARIEAERIALEAAEEKARLETERIEREKAEAIAKAKAEEEARLQAEAEEQARVEAELKAQAEAAEQARLEQERIAREAAEEEARIERERIAQEELAAKAKLEAEEQARLEAERIAREKAEAIAKAQAEEEARLQAEAERQARAEAEEQARIEAELKAQAEAAEQARLEQERIAREAAEEEARIERERIAQEELAAKAKLEAEEQARLEAERIAREKAEAIAKAEAEEEARLQAEAECQARAEAEEKARVEAERIAQVAAAEQKLREAERVAREEERARREAEEKERLEAEKLAREEAKRLAKEEKAAKAKLKAEEKARARALREPGMLDKLSFNKLLKPMLIAIPAVLVVVVGLIHVMNLSMLIGPVEKLATDSLGEPVKVQEVHASLFPPHLMLSGVAVGSNADIKIGSVNIVSAVSMLFNDVKDIKSLDITGATLTPADFARHAQWVNNVAKSGKLKIEKITLKQISFKVSDLEPEAFNGKVALTSTGALSNVELVNAGGNLTLLLTPQNGSAAVTLTASDWQPPIFKRLAFDEVTATGVISQNQLSFSQIEAKAFGGTIKAQGELSWDGRLSTSGNFELIKMTLPRVLSAYDSSASIEGSLNATGVFISNANQASALAQAAEVDASFEVLAGKVNGIALSHTLVAGPASKPSPDADFTRFDTLTGNLQFKDSQFKYKQFALKTEQFRARGNFNIESDQTVSGKVSAELTSASQRRQGNFTISGQLADVKFK